MEEEPNEVTKPERSTELFGASLRYCEDPTMITVYCDRVAKVEVASDSTIKCPKCDGTCTKQVPAIKVRYPVPMYDCLRCGRGWYIVPNKIKTESEADKWLEVQETKHLNDRN